MPKSDSYEIRVTNFIKDHQTLINKFHVEICDHSKEIDELNDVDWYALSIGWSLAKGLNIDDASMFANIVRYRFHYFQFQ